jgi:predicted RNase H-like nuclease
VTRVLGIDAAWTPHHPSGVALIERRARRWRVVKTASSYGAFVGASDPGWPGAATLLRAAGDVDAIGVDMPLATVPVTQRRACDTAVSRAYGAMKCATHSPTPERPGKLADAIGAELRGAGFPLATAATPAGTRKVALEVYPHAALIHLTGANERLRYKLARARKYWPDATPAERDDLLRTAWRRILRTLRGEIGDLDLPLPKRGAPLKQKKAFEDTLDAVICGWVAARYLDRQAHALGDATAAIWIPRAP